MTRCALLVVSLLLLAVAPWSEASAQQLVELAPGARVRIQAPGVVAGRYTGTVISRSCDTLVVASSAGASARVPISDLTSVEVSRGKSRSQGALKGIVWGAPIGLVLGLLTASGGGPEGESEGGYVGSTTLLPCGAFPDKLTS